MRNTFVTWEPYQPVMLSDQGNDVTGTTRISHVVAAVRGRQPTVVISGGLSLVINNKEQGHVHRLLEGTRNMPRDKRRTHCGWRAGSVLRNHLSNCDSMSPSC